MRHTPLLHRQIMACAALLPVGQVVKRIEPSENVRSLELQSAIASYARSVANQHLVWIEQAEFGGAVAIPTELKLYADCLLLALVQPVQGDEIGEPLESLANSLRVRRRAHVCAPLDHLQGY